MYPNSILVLVMSGNITQRGDISIIDKWNKTDIALHYGIDLVRLNKEETLRRTSYITYQFNQTPTRVHHPNRSDDEDTIISQRQPVEFTLRTPDMVMFFDFKNKYNNLDLLTNFCEFKTADRYGDRWTAAIKWQQITEDFNHTYQSDDNSNFSYQCQFRCELYFYEYCRNGLCSFDISYSRPTQPCSYIWTISGSCFGSIFPCVC